MKKLLFLAASLTLTLFASLAELHAASPALELDCLRRIRTAQAEYNEIQSKLKEAVELINEKGQAAFETIEKNNEKNNNGEGIFVIDPATGKILVSPSVESIGEAALKSSEINGKAIAREAILKAYTELYGTDNWESWANSMGEVYNSYLTQIAITMDGKVYAVAIGKSNADLQRLFVTTIVDKACKVIEELGTEKAFEVFNKENGMFRFKDTYIFVYEIKSADNLTCLYNPNYPDLVGKNQIDFKVDSGYVIRDIYNLLEKSNSGWLRSEAPIPRTKKLAAKDIYVEAVNVDGKKLAVGSGVYLAEHK